MPTREEKKKTIQPHTRKDPRRERFHFRYGKKESLLWPKVARGLSFMTDMTVFRTKVLFSDLLR